MSRSFNDDGLVKSQKDRHPREACPRPDRGAGVQNLLNSLDSRFHGNDKIWLWQLFTNSLILPNYFGRIAEEG